MKSSFRFIIASLAACVLLYACGTGNSAASSGGGLTTAQVQALINTAVAPLQQQITTLQSEVAASGATPAVFIHAPNAPTVTIKAQLRNKAASAPTCTGLGTLTGRPSDSDPIASNLISGISCAGYYFTLSGAATSADTSSVQPVPSQIPVWFDAPNCSGNAYVTVGAGVQSVSAGALANGAVFTVNGTAYMLSPGAAPAQPALLSQYVNGSCNAVNVAQLVVYPLAANDPTVSGVPNGSIQGPVTIN